MFVNMVLEDVTEYEITPEGKKVGIRRPAAPTRQCFADSGTLDVYHAFACILSPWVGLYTP